jgi:hypothetical protein
MSDDTETSRNRVTLREGDSVDEEEDRLSRTAGAWTCELTSRGCFT